MSGNRNDFPSPDHDSFKNDILGSSVSVVDAPRTSIASSLVKVTKVENSRSVGITSSTVPLAAARHQQTAVVNTSTNIRSNTASRPSSARNGVIQSARAAAPLSHRTDQKDTSDLVDTSRLARPFSPLTHRSNKSSTPDAVEARLQLESSKKALRELRTAERRMSWDLQREEKKFVKDVRKSRESELLAYYKQDSQEMKQYVSHKERERRVVELAEQKEYQEFKRFARDSHKEHMKKVWAEALDYSTAFSKWQEELKEAFFKKEKDLANVKKESFDVERVVKQWTKNMEQLLLSEEREWARQLEAEYALRKATEEQKKLDEKLKLLQAAKNRPLNADYI